MTAPSVSFDTLSRHLREQEFFENKTWRLAPRAFPLRAQEKEQLEQIGQACLEFLRAVENLYLKSVEKKSILRNRSLVTPWVADYYDRGKPAAIIRRNRSRRAQGMMPPVFRPDLLLTEDGFALTEMDSVPGGIGLTAFLNRIFGEDDPSVIGREDAILDGWYEALRRHVPERHSPLLAIVVSDEAATYRPEMEWLAERLRERGKRVYCLHPEDLIPLGTGLCCAVEGNPEKIDLIYRFFELYDLDHLPHADFLLQAWEEGEVELYPPPKTFQEEKLSLALFHHHLLEDYWRDHLSRSARRVLEAIIPRSWIVDPTPLPPNGVLDGPFVQGRPIHAWTDLTRASQRERSLILKISGFHYSAEGARSVLLGSDCSRDEWAEGLEEAVTRADQHPYIIQEYRKPMRRRHLLYHDGTLSREEEGRLRICPYYFLTDADTPKLSGVLCTFCPADKKIIHGMSDAAMLPARLDND